MLLMRHLNLLMLSYASCTLRLQRRISAEDYCRARNLPVIQPEMLLLGRWQKLQDSRSEESGYGI